MKASGIVGCMGQEVVLFSWARSWLVSGAAHGNRKSRVYALAVRFSSQSAAREEAKLRSK